jgi:hypothetical protein
MTADTATRRGRERDGRATAGRDIVNLRTFRDHHLGGSDECPASAN